MNHILRQIPNMNELLQQAPLVLLAETYSPELVKYWAQSVLDQLRREVRAGQVAELPPLDTLCRRVETLAEAATLPSLRGVINGTGVVLHTNLGRSCLAQEAVEAVAGVAAGYSTLEYDVDRGCRGSRHTHVEELLCRLTGAEAAMAVNNNAAAVMLVLTALAQDGEVITSRGELVEIGGAFRIPDIMELCGCRLKEVGTTNKTHLYDYERAINEETRALLKVHTSNFAVVGFTDSVTREEMAALGHAHGLPVVEDLGSGCLVDLSPYGIAAEPVVSESIRAGMDVVTFSGDKLLGGPQAGIVIGKAEYIKKMKSHPLARAVRLDKMTLAALEATLRLYLEGKAETSVPTLAMLAVSPETLQDKAQRLCAMLQARGVDARVTALTSLVGGGALPLQKLPGYAVTITPGRISVNELEERLRRRKTPIIGRISEEKYLLDVRTLRECDFAPLTEALAGEAI